MRFVVLTLALVVAFSTGCGDSASGPGDSGVDEAGCCIYCDRSKDEWACSDNTCVVGVEALSECETALDERGGQPPPVCGCLR